MSAVEPVEAELQAMRIREPELGLSSIRWQRQAAGMERDQLPTTDVHRLGPSSSPAMLLIRSVVVLAAA
jgi:hypothetical protein